MTKPKLDTLRKRLNYYRKLEVEHIDSVLCADLRVLLDAYDSMAADRAALEEARKLGFTWTDDEGIEWLIAPWNRRPWLFRKHPGAQWVSIHPVAETTKHAAALAASEYETPWPN